jgi:hypothetical protein
MPNIFTSLFTAVNIIASHLSLLIPQPPTRFANLLNLMKILALGILAYKLVNVDAVKPEESSMVSFDERIGINSASVIFLSSDYYILDNFVLYEDSI